MSDPSPGRTQAVPTPLPLLLPATTRTLVLPLPSSSSSPFPFFVHNERAPLFPRLQKVAEERAAVDVGVLVEAAVARQ